MRKLRIEVWRSAGLGAGAAVLSLAFAWANAQDLELAALHELDDDRTDIVHEDLSIDQLEDLDVVREGRKIGEVEAVLASGDEIVALVVDYEGDVQGMRDRDIVVPIGEFEMLEGRRAAELSLTDEELAELQTWDDD